MNKTVIKIMAALAIVTTLFSGFPVQAANYVRQKKRSETSLNLQ